MKVLAITRTIGLAAGVCLLAACRQTTPAATAAPKPSSPDVWANVDGREMRKQLVEQAYRSSTDPGTTPPPSPEEVQTAELNVLDQLITQDVLIARAQALAIGPTDAEVATAYGTRRGNMTDAAFELQLGQRSLTADDLKAAIRRELTVQKLLDHEVNAKVTVTDQQVTDFFNQNRPLFNLTEPQYRLAQILVTPVKDPTLRNGKNDDAGTPEEAKQKVDGLLIKLKAGSADFAQLAQDYSEDPQTVAQGGDLGFVPASALSRISPQLRDSVAKMQPGSITTISTNGNFAILALIESEPAGQRDLNTPGVKDNIRQTLTTRRQDLLRTAYVADARDNAKVINYLAAQALATK